MKSISVVAGIILKNDTYLIVDRPNGKMFAGLWEFPGGKIEKAEKPENALIRELKEEISISVTTLEFWKTKNYIYNLAAYNKESFDKTKKQKLELLKVHLSFYFIKEYKGEAISNEGQNLRWVKPLKALGLSFVEADQTIVKDLYHYLCK